MSNDINEKVDHLLNGDPIGNSHKRGHGRTRKIISLLVICGLIAVGVSGVLLVYFSQYTGSMTGDLDTHGLTTKLYFDGVSMTTESFTIPMDITDISSGEILTFPHTVEVLVGDGDWNMTFIPNWNFNDPMHEFFGFYFEITDSLDTSILNDEIYLKAGQGIYDMNWIYELDALFLENGVGLLPFDLSVMFTEHINNLPDANIDSFVIIAPLTTHDIYVLDNDDDWESPDNLDIVSMTEPDCGSAVIMGIYPNEYVEYTSDETGHDTNWYYTIEDENGDQDTAVIYANTV